MSGYWQVSKNVINHTVLFSNVDQVHIAINIHSLICQWFIFLYPFLYHLSQTDVARGITRNNIPLSIRSKPVPFHDHMSEVLPSDQIHVKHLHKQTS